MHESNSVAMVDFISSICCCIEVLISKFSPTMVIWSSKSVYKCLGRGKLILGTACRVYADWKVRENHIEIILSLESQGKSGNWKKCCTWSEKVRENIFVQICDLRVTYYCHLEIRFFNNSLKSFTFTIYSMYMIIECNISTAYCLP